ncbi:MAG: hypothetical protein DI598_16305 [Pseudopedobacter saltans]|uniref:Uncharacterized protein n=1 Tax=Pseudopedobacter saltans TaxID=151895 RepID=A0A2W5EK81_9SPHI|nr:MAG: hypothetical protein DI598_16305 [Pseudopedobacter saltans]
MTKEEILEIIKRIKNFETTELVFALKKRNTINGYIMQLGNFEYLNSKNYWHVLTFEKKEEWDATRNIDLIRLFPGDAFAKITKK